MKIVKEGKYPAASMEITCPDCTCVCSVEPDDLFLEVFRESCLDEDRYYLFCPFCNLKIFFHPGEKLMTAFAMKERIQEKKSSDMRGNYKD